MINNLKNKLFLVLGAVASGALIITFMCGQFSTKQPQLNLNCSQTCNQSTILSPEQFSNHVDLLMTSTWEQLEKNTGVTLTHCEDFLNEHGQQFKVRTNNINAKLKQKHGPVSAETTGLIQEILIDFNIDPNSIEIVKYQDPYFLAGIDDNTFYVDEENLRSYCPKAQRFVVAHELGHYKNKDQSIENALNKLVDTHNNIHEQCIHSFTYATEIRADITAMLKGPEYAQGAIAFFQEYMKQYGDCSSDTHPQPSKRLKTARDMDMMHAQQEQHRPTSILTA